MSNYPQSPAEYPAPPRPQKGWFGRNWWWFIPLIVLAPFICCCGSCAGCAYWGLQQLNNLPPYKDTVQMIQSDPRVQAELGTPIDVAGLIETAQSGGNFDISQSGNAAVVNVSVPISGPNGSGVLHIEATDNGTGNWTYTRREVVIDSSGKIIDLMPAGSTSPDTTPDPQPAQ